MVSEENWDVCPEKWKKNFRCYFIKTGKWRLEKKDTWGKTVFKIQQKDGSPNAPTFADQRNFFTGLFEAEWRNDNFIFSDGTARPPQREIKIQMFLDILNQIKERSDIKDTKRGIEFYLSKCRDEQNG